MGACIGVVCHDNYIMIPLHIEWMIIIIGFFFLLFLFARLCMCTVLPLRF